MGEAALADWLEEIGLADAPGLLEALTTHAGSLARLRDLSDDLIRDAVSPLQLKSLKQRRLHAALIELRAPRAGMSTGANVEADADGDAPPDLDRKRAPRRG